MEKRASLLSCFSVAAAAVAAVAARTFEPPTSTLLHFRPPNRPPESAKIIVTGEKKNSHIGPLPSEKRHDERRCKSD
jgi:hypothetical protein